MQKETRYPPGIQATESTPVAVIFKDIKQISTKEFVGLPVLDIYLYVKDHRSSSYALLSISCANKILGLSFAIKLW